MGPNPYRVALAMAVVGLSVAGGFLVVFLVTGNRLGVVVMGVLSILAVKLLAEGRAASRRWQERQRP